MHFEFFRRRVVYWTLVAVSFILLIEYLKPDVLGIFKNSTSAVRTRNYVHTSTKMPSTIANELKPTALINFCNSQLGNQVSKLIKNLGKV